MPFTPQQEALIIQRVNQLSDDDKKKHTQTTQVFFSFIGGFLGTSALEYALKNHGWPAIEKKLIEIYRKL